MPRQVDDTYRNDVPTNGNSFANRKKILSHLTRISVVLWKFADSWKNNNLLRISCNTYLHTSRTVRLICIHFAYTSKSYSFVVFTIFAVFIATTQEPSPQKINKSTVFKTVFFFHYQFNCMKTMHTNTVFEKSVILVFFYDCIFGWKSLNRSE